MRQRDLLMLVCAVFLATAGCSSRHIVRSAPSSVSTPPPQEAPLAAPLPPPQVEVTEQPPPEVPPPASTPAVKLPAPRPRPPGEAETAEQPPPKPAPPQISPQMSIKDLAAAKNNTTFDIETAEKNVQVAGGRQLNAAQRDLMEKIKGFLGQAHEAIAVDDWVRAENLAEKARVLSVELGKSF